MTETKKPKKEPLFDRLKKHFIIMKEVLLFGTVMPAGIFYSTATGFMVVYALLTKK